MGLIDIEMLAQVCPHPWPEEAGACQIVEVITHLGQTKKGGNTVGVGGAGAGAGAGGVGGLDAAQRAKKDRPVCAFKMRVTGGGDNITLRYIRQSCVCLQHVGACA